MPQTFIVLQSPNGQLWSLALDDLGGPIIAGASIGPVSAPVLRDADDAGNYYLLGISNGGALNTTLTSGTTQGSINFIRFYTLTNQQWLLMARSNGSLVTSKTAMPPLTTGQIVVGQLLPDGGYYPPFSQPNGVGTPVVPATPQGELTGEFILGCGHSIRSLDVDVRAVNGIESAVLKCPCCGFVQRIITPVSLLDDMANQILLP